MAGRFPLGFWNFGDYLDDDLAARVAEWDDLGFSWAMTPPFDGANPDRKARVAQLLDLAGERGIQVLVYDQRAEAPGSPWHKPDLVMPLPEGYRERAAAAVRDWASHPAAWGLYIGDEPLIGNLPAVAEACGIVRSLTDRLHPYVNLLPDHIIDGGVGWQVGFADYGAYLDHYLQVTGDRLLCYDCYCQTSPELGGRDRYFKNLAEVQAASLRQQLPFWIITLSMGHWMYRAPTERELLWEMNSALAYGAQGILWFLYRHGGSFGYGAPVDELGQRGPLYAAMRRQHAWFRKHWEECFKSLQVVRTMHYPAAPDGCQGFTPDGFVLEAGALMGNADLIISEFVDKIGRPYVMVVNNDCQNPVRPRLRFKGSQVFRINESGESPAGSWASGPVGFEDYILPGDAVLFRVEL